MRCNLSELPPWRVWKMQFTGAHIRIRRRKRNKRHFKKFPPLRLVKAA